MNIIYHKPKTFEDYTSRLNTRGVEGRLEAGVAVSTDMSVPTAGQGGPNAVNTVKQVVNDFR